LQSSPLDATVNGDIALTPLVNGQTDHALEGDDNDHEERRDDDQDLRLSEEAEELMPDEDGPVDEIAHEAMADGAFDEDIVESNMRHRVEQLEPEEGEEEDGHAERIVEGYDEEGEDEEEEEEEIEDQEEDPTAESSDDDGIQYVGSGSDNEGDQSEAASEADATYEGTNEDELEGEFAVYRPEPLYPQLPVFSTLPTTSAPPDTDHSATVERYASPPIDPELLVGLAQQAEQGLQHRASSTFESCIAERYEQEDEGEDEATVILGENSTADGHGSSKCYHRGSLAVHSGLLS
jgi:hypothetical protein